VLYSTASACDLPVRRIRLHGNCQILSLGSPLDPASVDAGPFHMTVISVRSPADIWRRRANPALDDFEVQSTLSVTDENTRVSRYARGRNLLSSTVFAYVDLGETVVDFGKGGSESMTIFVRKDGQTAVTVRKVLSEALTAAKWSRQGTGVMQPPYAKAKNQSEYLRALPDSVRGFFPAASSVLAREIPVPDNLRGERSTTHHHEVIYEMNYVPGQEVSRFVERHSPSPIVVARVYEQIFTVLDRKIHRVHRGPAPGDTLETSYFRKIEDRLALCRRTAPRTFNRYLLDTEQIVINGVRYLNSAALLARLRAHPEFLEVLEPRVHSLVMGDTNTENIKLTHTEPLLVAQRLIESGAPAAQIDAALAAITPESLGIRFLDPRAIGFRSEGRTTRDDPMYDNKPWHNSIGHYDEIHRELFTVRTRIGEGHLPSIDIEFAEGNPFQRAYRGIEDHFASVMTAVYDLDNPESAYLRDDPYWLIRFVFLMGTHFTAMPPFHFQAEPDGTLIDTYQTQRRPVAIYSEGVKWLNWALEMLQGKRTEFHGLKVPPLPYLTTTVHSRTEGRLS
jgi:hypothetical protein